MTLALAKKPSHDKAHKHKSEVVRNSSITSQSTNPPLSLTTIQPKPVCPCGGGCPKCKDNHHLLQPKLKVNEPGGIYEQEADRIADQIMRTPDDEVTGISHVSTNMERKCTSCASGEELCPECEQEEEGLIQKNVGNADPSTEFTLSEAEVPGTDLRSVQNDNEVNDTNVSDEFLHNLGPGQPLDSATRFFFEPRFGYDFSNVRVHSGSEAVESAEAVNAVAYTVGQDIVFSSGHYSPEWHDGRRLLAHELAHTIQQSVRSTHSAGAETTLTHHEREAGATATTFITAGKVHVQPHAAAPDLQMQQEQQENAETISWGVEVRERYIQLADEKIAEIQEAVANGRIWFHEDEDILLGSELLEGTVEGATVERRLDVLARFICALREVISWMQSGSVPLRNWPRPPLPPGLDLASLVNMSIWGDDPFALMIDWGWLIPPGGMPGFIFNSPFSTPILQPAELPWWTCGPEAPRQRTARVQPSPTSIRVTAFWVHIRDPVRHPSIADGIEQGAPSSSLYLGRPNAAGVTVEGRGESFPLLREGNRFFYMLGERRIYLPNLPQQFPDLIQ